MLLRRFPARAAMLAAALSIGACSGMPPARGYPDVATTLTARGLEPPATPGVEDPVLAALTEAPLTVETAQRVALARNPTLRAQFAALGFAQADLYDAARLANPRFALGWLDAAGGGAQVTLGLAQNVAELLTLTPRRRIAEGELARTKEAAAAALMQLAADVEAAWVRHVAALAARELRQAIADAASVSADFAAALQAAGNINQLALDRERAAAESTALDAVRTQTRVASTRAALATLMGVGAEIGWSAEAALPLPVAREDTAEELQRIAGSGRLDLLAARRAVTLLEDSLGLARSWRWLGAFELGVEHERDPDGGRLTGPTLQLELPVFNQGAGRVLRAEARLDAARANASAIQLAVGNEVAQAQVAVATQRELLTRMRDHLLPLRERIVAGAQQMQHFMLIGQFDVLQDKLAQYRAYEDYLAALADYWLARARLARAIGAPLPSGRGRGHMAPATLLTTPSVPAAHSH